MRHSQEREMVLQYSPGAGMVTVEIKISGRDLIASGCVVLEGAEPEASFKLDNLTLVIKFEDTSETKTDVVGVIDNESMALTLKNFKNPLGTAYNAKLGTMNGRELYGAFFVHGIAGSNGRAKLMNYTFTAGDVVDGK